jgi:hypothetical protein
MIYSLPAKVIEVTNENTVVVQLKDKTKINATKEQATKLKVNDFISIIPSGKFDGKFEMCGKEKLKMDFVWDR